MILYTDSTANISPEQLTGFFVGWPKPPSTKTHLKLLENATHIVLAIDDHSQQVVGFINAISDGVLSAYIPLLEVLPEYQLRGIARELVKQMLAKCKRLYMVDLTCDENLQPFYEKLGLTRMTGMMIRNFDKQSG